MPVAIPLIVAAAVGLGESIYSATNQPSSSSTTPSTTSAITTQTQAQQQAEKAAIANQAPTLQSQLGGAVSPDYFISQSATDAGFAGDTNLSRQALQGFLGLGSGSDVTGTASPGSVATGSGTPVASSSSPFSDILSRFYPGGSSSTDQGLSGGYA